MGMDGHSGFRRLDRLTRAVESKFEPLAEFAAALSHERAISRELGGRTVFDDREAPRSQRSRAIPAFSNFNLTRRNFPDHRNATVRLCADGYCLSLPCNLPMSFCMN